MFSSSSKKKSTKNAPPPQRGMNISGPTGAKHVGHLGNDGNVSQNSASKDWERINSTLNSRLKTMGAQGLSTAEVNFVKLQLEKAMKNPSAPGTTSTDSRPAQNTQWAAPTRPNPTSPTTPRSQASTTSAPKAQTTVNNNQQSRPVNSQSGSEFTKERYDYYRERCKKLENLVPRARDLNTRVKQLEAKYEQVKKMLQNEQKIKLELEKAVRTLRANVGGSYDPKSETLQNELDNERHLRRDTEDALSTLEVELRISNEENLSLREQIDEQNALIKRLENGFQMAMDQLDKAQSAPEPIPENPYGDYDDTPSLLSGIDPELLANFDPSMGDDEMMNFLTQALMSRRASSSIDNNTLESMLGNYDDYDDDY